MSRAMPSPPPARCGWQRRMDALMAALVAAALAQVGDRPAWLAAILADRYRKPALVLLAAACALAAASAISAVAGALIAPHLAPNARQLLLGLVLVLQGGGAFLAVKPPDRLAGWRIGAALTSFLGLFILVFGDGLMFIVLALAARSPVPALAAVGATLGGIALLAPAALMGEAAWLKLPLLFARRVVGGLFLLAGLALGLGGLGLI